MSSLQLSLEQLLRRITGELERSGAVISDDLQPRVQECLRLAVAIGLRVASGLPTENDERFLAARWANIRSQVVGLTGATVAAELRTALTGVLDVVAELLTEGSDDAAPG